MEIRYCPHCKMELTHWEAPPDTGWGTLLVCFNNECSFYRNSVDDIENKGDERSRIGCRYAEDPANNYQAFNLLAYCPF